MSHRVTTHSPQDRRRALIALSSASTLAIIALWIVYMQYALGTPDGAPESGTAAIFASGIDSITHIIRTGLVNSYMYFHSLAADGVTYTIQK